MRCAKNVLNYFDYKPPLEEKKDILKPLKAISTEKEEEKKSVPLIKAKSTSPVNSFECDSVVV